MHPDYNIYDFRSAAYISPFFLKKLESIQFTFAQEAEKEIAKLIHQKASITVVSCKQQPFSKWIKEADSIACGARFEMPEIDGWGLVVMDNTISYAAINKLLGGGNGALNVMRPFNNVEMAVNRKLINTLLKKQQEAWKNEFNLSFFIDHLGTQIRSLLPIPTIHIFCTLTFQIDLDSKKGFVHFLFSSESLKKIDTNLELEYSEKLNVDAINLELKASLGRLNLSAEELSNLTEGDVVKLNMQSHQPINIEVNNQAILKGIPGLFKQSKAILLKGDYHARP